MPAAPLADVVSDTEPVASVVRIGELGEMLAPIAGPVKVTTVPTPTLLPYLSVSVALIGAAKAVKNAVLWPAPEVMVAVLAAAGVTVSLAVADVTPVRLAV